MINFVSQIKVADELKICYEGHFRNDKAFAYTITSRKLYRNPEQFRAELYKFLSNINYKTAIIGSMEYHENSVKVHAHCIGSCGNPPKGNTTNDFHIRIDKIHNINGWIGYINKHNHITIEQASEIRSGIFDLHRKKICLFDDDTTSDEESIQSNK